MAPQFPPARPGLFQQTPPAMFPPVFGLMGLGLGWRRAGEAFSVPAGIGEAVLGAVTLLYLFAVVAYLVKVLRRPGVVVEDMGTMPGRAGLASGAMTGMLLGFVLAPMSLGTGRVVLVLAVLAHVVLAAIALRGVVLGPAEARRVTPVWHLTYVGFIVSAMAALPLGWAGYAQVVFWISLVVAVAIWVVSVAQMSKAAPPPPLRPMLAIHLAPASLLGLVAYLSGQAGLGFVFGLLAIAIMAVLLVRGPWLVADGFSPFWGAFTFPLAAFANLMMLMGSAGEGGVFRLLGGLALVAGTLFIPWVAYKVLQLWAKGQLAVKTNAAKA